MLNNHTFKLLIATIIFMIYGDLFAQSSRVVWDYPVKPGTDAWKSLRSSQEMIDACQIPTDVLAELSTPDLARLCLNYPLLGDMLLANNYQEGFEKLSQIFNGLQELIKRKDAGSELLNLYGKFDLDHFKRNKGTGFKNYFLDMCIEVVMSQPVFLETLNPNQEKQLMNEALKKLKTRDQVKDSFYRQTTTAVILSRTLARNNIPIKRLKENEKDKFRLLNNYFILSDESLIEKIRQEAQSYLEN